MKKIAFSLLSIIMLVAMALPVASMAVLAGGGDVNYIVISPDNASINGGGEETQAYTAEAFDAQGNSLGDVTRDTEFTIQPEAGGSWEGCIYTSKHVGDWMVTGTHITGKTDTATLQVPETPEYPGGSPVSPNLPGANTETERPARSTPVLAGEGSVQTQMAMILDGSGSISSTSWSIMKNGLANAIENSSCVPQNGTVELTVVQFGDWSPKAQLEVGPVVITAGNAATIANDIRNISQMGGYTPLACGIYLAADTLYGSTNFNPNIKQAINLVTDGEPNRCCNNDADPYESDPCPTGTNARASAEAARNHLLTSLNMTSDQDEFDAEFIGTQGTASDWLKDSIVWPQSGYYAPPFDKGPGWVRVVATVDEFAATICEKFERILYGSITAHKFNDLNGNGIQDTGEPDLEGWTMTLHEGSDCTGTILDSNDTNANGNVVFTGLEEGTYSVAETLKNSWINSTELCQHVTIATGESATLNFGNYHLPGEPPHLEVDKSVSPESICIDDQATVTLTVTGAGDPAEEHLPLDVVLIIDRSGSMAGTPLADAKTAAKTFVGLLNSTSDRSGLVSYHTTATLNHNLTFNQSAINSSIDSLSAGDWTNIGDGISTANTELIDNGRTRPPVIYAEILLSDGQPNRPSSDPIGAALAAAQQAANNTIIIYTIGLTSSVDEDLMQDIANMTGGKYYYAPDSTDLEGIYQDIAEELSNIAGTNVVVTEVLPGDVNYEGGTAVPSPNSTSSQTLTWELGTIVINQTKTITFNVTFNNTGYQLVDVYPDTRVNYTNYLGDPASAVFPETYITVTAAPVANFSVSDQNPCVNTDVNFTDESTGGPTNWTWDFGDGGNSTTQNPIHQYGSVGTYNVTLNVTNACGSNATTKTNYINVTAAPVANFSVSDQNPCVNTDVNFTDESTGGPTNWTWDFGDGGNSTTQNPIHQYGSVGTYNVTLNVTGECGSNATTKTNYINVTAAPVANFSVSDQNPCVNTDVNFTDESTGGPTNWTWDFGDGGNSTTQNPIHQYGSVGTYNVTLNVTGECGSNATTKTNYINVTAAPVANFSVSDQNPCVNTDVNFTDESTGGPTNWTWDFGDGGNSTTQNPIHQYGSVGTYNVTLNVTNACGSNATTKTNYINVTAAPVANFSVSDQNPCVNTDVNFTDESTGGPTNWTWDFGDGGNSTTQNPIHQYGSVGTYNVTLNVTGECGSNFTTKPNFITVSPKPVAAFNATPLSGCVPLTVNFTDLSTGNITSWNWTFGDGGNSTTQNPIHQYGSVGTYNVTLNVTGECGSNFTTKPNFITVSPKPVAAFNATPLSGCVPLTVNFTDLSTGNITSWNWTFGDGNFSSAQNASHQYASNGTYNVTLNVTGECGSNFTTKPNFITVSPKPVAAFNATPLSGCVPLTVNFTDLSTGNITSWNWTFGDGNFSSAQNASHQYASNGTYNVTLNVTGECGSNFTTKPNFITVSPKPVAAFNATPLSGCVPLTVNFTDLSTGNITSWNWTFGDGNFSSAQNASHQYASNGTYNVTLNVTGECGSNFTTKPNFITVSPKPVAAITPASASGYAPLTVTFTDKSTPIGEIDSWSWDFPGGSPSTASTKGPHTVTYTSVGTYTVNLTVSNDCGCNTTTAKVTVTTKPTPGGGGGGGGRAPCYLDIDMLGNITRVEITCTTSRTLESKVAPDFNNTNFLEIDYGTTVICNALGEAPEALMMRVANQSPPVPDGSALVGSAYNFSGNYGYKWLKYCSGVTFGQNVTIVLDYDPNEVPESTTSLAIAYYDTELGIWVSLSPDIGRVAEVGKATGQTNRFSTVAVIAELAPTVTPASFVGSALSIEQSPQVWKNIFVGVTGKDVTITANVANNGGQEGTYTAELKLNGETVDTKEVTLAAGQSQQVTFTRSGMDYGQYEVEVAGLSGEFTVSRIIDWWSIFGIILAVGLITWAAIWWGRKRRGKAAQPAESEVTEGIEE